LRGWGACAGQKKETRFIRLLAKQTTDAVVAEVSSRDEGVVEQTNPTPLQLKALMDKHPELGT
jgi:hypothetical protein